MQEKKNLNNEPIKGWKIVEFPTEESIGALKEMWKKPVIHLTRFNKPFFENLDSFLTDYGFKPTSLPWRMSNERYSIVQVEDTDGNEEVNPNVYAISITTDDEQVYRGRLRSSIEAAYVFGLVIENKLNVEDNVFPKLPIESVKFNVARTSIWAEELKTDELYPGTTVQEEPECYGNALAPIRYMRTKEFYTAKELIDYVQKVENPLVISLPYSCIPYPNLEIYDDYRE